MYGRNKKVIKGSELLRVNSEYAKAFSNRKNQLIVILMISGLSFGIFWLAKILTITENAYLAIPMFILFACLLLICLSFFKRNSVLIITENGVVNYPTIVEIWENISSYEWKECSGINRLLAPLPFTKSKGISLILHTKKFRLKYGLQLDNLIFFNSEQIKAAEQIFKKYGIRKNN